MWLTEQVGEWQKDLLFQKIQNCLKCDLAEISFSLSAPETSQKGSISKENIMLK